jgi:hypothetical protein
VAEEADGALRLAKGSLETRLDGLGVGQARALALRWFMELHKGFPPTATAPPLATRQLSSR